MCSGDYNWLLVCSGVLVYSGFSTNRIHPIGAKWSQCELTIGLTKVNIDVTIFSSFITSQNPEMKTKSVCPSTSSE